LYLPSILVTPCSKYGDLDEVVSPILLVTTTNLSGEGFKLAGVTILSADDKEYIKDVNIVTL